MTLPTSKEVREGMDWKDRKALVPEGGMSGHVPSPARISLLYERSKVIWQSIGLERMSKHTDRPRLAKLIQQADEIDAEMEEALWP